MYRKNKLLLILIFVCLTLSLFLTPVANADGCIFIPTVEQWMISYEEKQIGIINYENGIERLTLIIDIKNSSLNTNEAFWLFPVPGHENVDIGIIKDINFFRGGYSDIRHSSKRDLINSAIFMSFSQAYISFIPLLWYYTTGFYSMGSTSNKDITIYENVEKMGLSAQLISANNSQALEEYLEEKNIILPDNATKVISEYIGKDYSFVVSWISDIDTFKKEAYVNASRQYYWYYGEPFYVLGVTVDFPTKEIFYPLKITSLYDEKIIPILIQVNGFVTPKNTFDNMYVDYYLGYTEIQIRTASKDFTDDLWIKDQAPLNIQIAKFVKTNLFLISIFLFILSSVFASIVSAAIVYFKNKPVYWKFAMIGLSNFLSIFFVFIMCLHFKIDRNFIKTPIEKERKVSKTFNLAFHITFLVLGLFCLALFLSTFFYFSVYRVFFILSIMGIPIGILMFIYGGIKKPKITLFTGLFSLFFFVFLIAFNVVLQTVIS